jgi:hypothetical protein
MDSFLADARSLHWWIGVVLVGILLNVIAAYLKAGTDRLGSAVSRDWRSYSSARTTARDAAITHLQNDPHEQVMLRLEVIDDRISGMVSMASGALFAVAFKNESGWLIALGALMFMSGALHLEKNR